MQSNNNSNPFRSFMIIGAVSLLLAVCFGAMGAHGLKPLLEHEQLESFKTGVQYQFYHGLVLLFLPSLKSYLSVKVIRQSSILFSIGILFFSFSIYFLSLRFILDMPNLSTLGPVTPLGGLLFISGWLVILTHLIFKK